jgi:hypothetical protein
VCSFVMPHVVPGQLKPCVLCSVESSKRVDGIERKLRRKKALHYNQLVTRTRLLSRVFAAWMDLYRERVELWKAYRRGVQHWVWTAKARAIRRFRRHAAYNHAKVRQFFLVLPLWLLEEPSLSCPE